MKKTTLRRVNVAVRPELLDAVDEALARDQISISPETRAEWILGAVYQKFHCRPNRYRLRTINLSDTMYLIHEFGEELLGMTIQRGVRDHAEVGLKLSIPTLSEVKDRLRIISRQDDEFDPTILDSIAEERDYLPSELVPDLAHDLSVIRSDFTKPESKERREFSANCECLDDAAFLIRAFCGYMVSISAESKSPGADPDNTVIHFVVEGLTLDQVRARIRALLDATNPDRTPESRAGKGPHVYAVNDSLLETLREEKTPIAKHAIKN